MTCDLWREKLDAYVDMSCQPEDLAALEEHMRGCPSCAAEALSRLQMKRAVRAAAARFTPTPEFRLRIEKTVRKKRRPPAFLGIPGLAAAAAAILLAVVFTALLTRHAAREQALAELVDLHVAAMASANPVDVVSTDRHTVKPWFQGKLPFAFNLPDLDNSAFRLVGGRVTYFEHNPGAQLLFELRKHELSVFIFADHAGALSPDAGVSAIREKGFSVETWRQDGLRYAVVGDASPDDIHALAELMRAAGHF